MDLETCMKYLNFVAGEADRYLKGGMIRDEYVVSLTNDLDNFKLKSKTSDLPDWIKVEISRLDFDYNFRKVNAGFWLLIMAFLTIGLSALFIYSANQSKRKKLLENIRNQTSSLLIKIKMSA